MAIPASVIFIWSSTNASIPAGWSRETTLDGIYPKGTALAVDPDVTGGATTHTHTAVAHSHTDTHVHSISFATSAATGTGRVAAGSNINAHTHAAFNSGAVSGGGLSSVTSTYAALANDPPYHEVIFIKPDAPVAGIADDGICFVDTSDVKGMVFCNGSNGTPDLRNKYLKGAATDADAGGTGGSLTNVHGLTHTHVVSSHTHVSATSGQRTNGSVCVTNSGTGYASSTHTHAITLSGATTVTLTGSISLTTIETIEPAYRKLIPVQNQTGSTLEEVGMIGMWLGTLANIPSGWSEVPLMREKHLKCANLTTEAGTSGGANTHTHAAQNHTHTGNAHTHATPTTTAHNSIVARADDNVPAVIAADTHAITVANGTSSYNNASTTGASSSNEPEYRTVAFIKLTNIISGGAFLFNLI